MNPTTTMTSIRPTILQSTRLISRTSSRYRSTEAGPSTPSLSHLQPRPPVPKFQTPTPTQQLGSSKPYSPSSKQEDTTLLPSSNINLPVKTLESLVNLHHKASTFLQNPTSKEIHSGFEKVFKSTRVIFENYAELSERSEAVLTARKSGEKYREKGGSLESVGTRFWASPFSETSSSQAAAQENAIKPPRAEGLIDVWRSSEKKKSWSEKNDYVERAVLKLSERELAVREALCGTFQRGEGRGVPGLEGVLEFAKAKGVTLEELDQEWKNRDVVVENEKAR